MNKRFITILVGAFIIVGAGVLLFGKNNDTNSSRNPATNQTKQASTDGTSSDSTEMTGNLQTLRTGGKAQECSMSYSDDAGSGSGKMYTDGKGRGRIQISLKTSRGNTGESNTLVTDEKIYSWTTAEGASFGFVINASTVPAGSTSSPTTSSSQTAGKDFSLKCKGWSIDESVLSVPTDVKFSELTTGGQ